MIKMQALFRGGDQHIGRYGDPYLRLHGVLAGAEERLDTQVLLDPFEEKLDLLALAVQFGNQLRFQDKVVGQKDHALAGVVLDHDTAHRRPVVLARIVGREHAGLVAQHRSVYPIDRMRVAPLEFVVALGAGHKEAPGLVDDKQPGKIQVASVHQI